jgi:hypothetical protein
MYFSVHIASPWIKQTLLFSGSCNLVGGPRYMAIFVQYVGQALEDQALHCFCSVTIIKAYENR